MSTVSSEHSVFCSPLRWVQTHRIKGRIVWVESIALWVESHHAIHSLDLLLQHLLVVILLLVLACKVLMLFLSRSGPLPHQHWWHLDARLRSWVWNEGLNQEVFVNRVRFVGLYLLLLYHVLKIKTSRRQLRCCRLKRSRCWQVLCKQACRWHFDNGLRCLVVHLDRNRIEGLWGRCQKRFCSEQSSAEWLIFFLIVVCLFDTLLQLRDVNLGNFNRLLWMSILIDGKKLTGTVLLLLEHQIWNIYRRRPEFLLLILR